MAISITGIEILSELNNAPDDVMHRMVFVLENEAYGMEISQNNRIIVANDIDTKYLRGVGKLDDRLLILRTYPEL